MDIDKIFITDATNVTGTWIELIDQFGSDKHRSDLDNLDAIVCSMVERKRDKLSYYHGKKRAAVHLGNCYQQVITDLLTEVLVSIGITKDLIYCIIDGEHSEYFLEGELLLETEQIERLMKPQENIEAKGKDVVRAIYSNEIYMGKQ